MCQVLMNLTHNMCLDTIFWKLLPHLPGANESMSLVLKGIFIIWVSNEVNRFSAMGLSHSYKHDTDLSLSTHDFNSSVKYINGLVQDCSISIANALEILQSCTKRSICGFNTLRPRQNGCHFADDTFKRIFMNENVRISINISLKFVPKGLINIIPALVQIMAWRRPGDKPLSEPMIINLLTYIWVTRPQWVKQHHNTQYQCP